MVYKTQMRQVRFGGLDGPAQRDVVLLVAVVFVTYSAQFFTSALSVLRLSDAVWLQGQVWRAVSYPFIGLANGGLSGRPMASVFILLELFILYMFASDVFRVLGRRRFWRTLVFSTAGAAIIALVVHAVGGLATGDRALGGQAMNAFVLMQGQRMVLAVIIAAYAVLRANATILLFFVLPIKARWFLWLEIAFAFIGFLSTKDFAGFVGVCAAIGLTVWFVRHPTLKGGLHELRLRTEQRVLQRRLGRMRNKSKLRVVRGEGESSLKDPSKKDEPPWVN